MERGVEHIIVSLNEALNKASWSCFVTFVKGRPVDCNNNTVVVTRFDLIALLLNGWFLDLCDRFWKITVRLAMFYFELKYGYNINIIGLFETNLVSNVIYFCKYFPCDCLSPFMH